MSFLFHNYFMLLRVIVPKLFWQHIFLTLILRVSDPGAPSNRVGCCTSRGLDSYLQHKSFQTIRNKSSYTVTDVGKIVIKQS